jgi:hypothetical protein
MRKVGTFEGQPFLWPVSLAEAVAIGKEAGLEALQLRPIDEALAAFGTVVEASYVASLYRLRDRRLTREPERVAALAAIGKARDTIASVGTPDVRAELREALTLVESEIDGPRDRSLAAEIQKALFYPTNAPLPAVDSPGTMLRARILESASLAAMRDYISSRARTP